MLMDSAVKWSHSADVVVLGLGAAGAVAAITAHDRGAKVLVIEKQPADSHVTTSTISGGLFICPTDARLAREYMEHISAVEENSELSWTDREVIATWAEYACQNVAWLEGMGGRTELWHKGGEHDAPGRDSIVIHRFSGRGVGLMRFLLGQIRSRNIPVMYGTAARKLLTDLHREVRGVRCLSQEREVNVRAGKAVILATGGFEYDEAMKLNYLKVYPSYFTGPTSNTGDGIRMALDVGASLWHMNCTSAACVLKFPDMPIALGPNFGGDQTYGGWRRSAVSGPRCGFIIVDKFGRRYTSEEYKRHTMYYEMAAYDTQRLTFPRVPSYWIFDRTRFEAGPLPLMWYGPMQVRMYPWSKDNSKELQKGYFIRASGIRNLARKLDMEPSVLEKTLHDYNGYCELGEDPEFYRGKQHLVPIKDPPFFAVKLWPGGPNTQGGPRRNHRAQVLDTDDKPIPRLYGAGECGSIYGLLYPAGGGNLAECIAMGRVAGENAAGQ